MQKSENNSILRWMAKKSNLIAGQRFVKKRSSHQITAGKIVNRDQCAHSGDKLISKRLLKKRNLFVFSFFPACPGRTFFHGSSSKRDMKLVHISCFDDTQIFLWMELRHEKANVRRTNKFEYNLISGSHFSYFLLAFVDAFVFGGLVGNWEWAGEDLTMF